MLILISSFQTRQTLNRSSWNTQLENTSPTNDSINNSLNTAGGRPKQTNPHRQLNNYKAKGRQENYHETRVRDAARSKTYEGKVSIPLAHASGAIYEGVREVQKSHTLKC
jgi:hypothetical protein